MSKASDGSHRDIAMVQTKKGRVRSHRCVIGTVDETSWKVEGTDCSKSTIEKDTLDNLPEF